jgi:beta-mannanase
MDGDVYGTGYGDAPWDLNTWDLFENHAAKKASINHFGQPAPWQQAFVKDPFVKTAARGEIPYVSINSGSTSLSSIASGTYDTAMTTWAQGAKAYGKPFFLRWNWEMNGTWFNWGAQAKADPASYVASWRRFHDIVERAGATNVTWVWCPNTVFTGSTSLASLYPGDAYVDWTCADGYNFGTLPFKRDVWKSFSTVMKPTYDALLGLAPSKPIMIGELGTTEVGGSKAGWITDALSTQLPLKMPRIKAMVWFNWNITENGGTHDWHIESSSSAQSAFSKAISSPYYTTNTYGSLPALTKVPTP